ncbi:Importin-13 [Smittium mucronatum]|uniref:Importin-13 n=1 Tax=Smittium mucronatum TaxID=133383 RepID=A0A1R0GX84_9FUNG|nr:Importin-13 [Smittium mucronatum]
MALDFTGFEGSMEEKQDTITQVVGFWSSLEDSWADYKEYSSDQNLEDSDIKIKTIENILQDLFYQLTSKLLIKTQFPSEREWSSYDSELKELFRGYRREASEVIQSCYRVLGVKMISLLVDETSRLLKMENNDRVLSWQQQESLISAIRFISEEILPNPAEPVKNKLDELFLICLGENVMSGYQGEFLMIMENPRYPSLFHSSILGFIGTYSELLSLSHFQVLNAVKCIISAFGNPKLAAGATRAFKLLCENCYQSLGSVVPDLTSVTLSLLQNTDVLGEKDIVRILTSIGSVIGGLENPEEKIKYSVVIMNKLLDVLDNLLLDKNGNVVSLECILNMLVGFIIGLQNSENDEDNATMGNSQVILGSNSVEILNASDSEKQKFVNLLLGTRQASRFKGVIEDFVSKCRGLGY